MIWESDVMMSNSGVFYYLNSSVNPVLYSVMSTRFRAAFSLYMSDSFCNKNAAGAPAGVTGGTAGGRGAGGSSKGPSDPHSINDNRVVIPVGNHNFHNHNQRNVVHQNHVHQNNNHRHHHVVQNRITKDQNDHRIVVNSGASGSSGGGSESKSDGRQSIIYSGTGGSGSSTHVAKLPMMTQAGSLPNVNWSKNSNFHQV